MTGDIEEQRRYHEYLRIGDEFISKLRPDAREAVNDAFTSGNSEYIKDMMGVLLKYVKNPQVIERALDYYQKRLENQKKRGVESSEAQVAVGKVVKYKLSELKKSN